MSLLHKNRNTALQLFCDLIGFQVDKDKFFYQLRKLAEASTLAKKNISNDNQWTHFKYILKTNWSVVAQRSPEEIQKRPGSPPPPLPSKKLKLAVKTRNDCEKCPVFKAKIDALEVSLKNVKDEHSDKLLKQKASDTLKLETAHSQILQLKQRIKDSKEEWSDKLAKSKQLFLDEKVKVKMLKENCKCKRWKEKVKNHKKTIKNLRRAKNNFYAQLKRRSTNPIELSNKLRNEKIRVAFRDKKLSVLSGVISKLEKDKLKLEKEIKNLELYIDDIECSNAASEDLPPPPENVTVKQFDPDVRRVIYEALHSKVPLAHAQGLITCTLKTLGNHDTPVLPSKSTIARMSTEVSVLSCLQAVEALLDSDCATLAWDATTLAGKHLNEIHIQTESKTFTVSVQELPGGKTVEYVAHITSVINRMAELYGAYRGLDAVAVKEQIISKIRSTMSDRASVNSCVVRELRQLWSIDLVELHCNLHPLDSFSSQIRSSLKNLDSEWSLNVTGRDCCVANFLYCLSKLRIKEKGDPAGFSTFLRKHGVSPRKILRYVGNRWNVLFKMSATVLEHQSLIQLYLDKYCRNSGQLRNDLLWAISNESVLIQMRALALIGRLITTPWVELFYGNKDKLSNLECIPQLKKFSENLTSMVHDPSLLLTSPNDIFGRSLRNDPLLLWLQDSLPSEKLMRCLKDMLSSIDKVTNRQLERYLSGELSDVTPELLEATKASTPHNVWAERVLGTLNAFWERGKQSSFEFLESRLIATTNDTMFWLDGMDKNERDSVIQFAVKMSAKLRNENAQRKIDLKKAAGRKLTEMGQKRDSMKRKEFEKKIFEILKSDNRIACLEEEELYADLGDNEKELIKGIAAQESLKNTNIRHEWDEGDETTETYNGTFQTTVKRKNGLLSYRVKYWLTGLEEASELTNMPSEQLIADILLGDLKIRG